MYEYELRSSVSVFCFRRLLELYAPGQVPEHSTVLLDPVTGLRDFSDCIEYKRTLARTQLTPAIKNVHSFEHACLLVDRLSLPPPSLKRERRRWRIDARGAATLTLVHEYCLSPGPAAENGKTRVRYELEVEYAHPSDVSAALAMMQSYLSVADNIHTTICRINALVKSGAARGAARGDDGTRLVLRFNQPQPQPMEEVSGDKYMSFPKYDGTRYFLAILDDTTAVLVRPSGEYAEIARMANLPGRSIFDVEVMDGPGGEIHYLDAVVVAGRKVTHLPTYQRVRYLPRAAAATAAAAASPTDGTIYKLRDGHYFSPVYKAKETATIDLLVIGEILYMQNRNGLEPFTYTHAAATPLPPLPSPEPSQPYTGIAEFAVVDDDADTKLPVVRFIRWRPDKLFPNYVDVVLSNLQQQPLAPPPPSSSTFFDSRR
jgi:hypothetical protein